MSHSSAVKEGFPETQAMSSHGDGIPKTFAGEGGGKRGIARELPGHIRKAFRSVERFLPVVDVIVELLDARLPFSSRLPGLVERLGKASLVVLGKSDLADSEKTDSWIAWFESSGQLCTCFRTDDPESGKNLIKKIKAIAAEKKGSKKTKVVRIMVIGIPNVGKSTLINCLAGRRAARVANLPGVTRDIQWVKLQGDLELLDLPGVLDFSLLKKGELLRCINTMPGNNEDPEATAIQLFRILANNNLLEILPGFKRDFDTFENLLELYAAKRNFLNRGGGADIRRASIDVLKQFQNGSFGRVTLEMPDNTPEVSGRNKERDEAE